MVRLEEATTKSDIKKFIKFPFALYKKSPYWVPPLISDELETFDKQKNPNFNNAEARFFLAYKKNELVGRIAAIINWIEVNEQRISKMRFGWFDFIDDIVFDPRIKYSEFKNQKKRLLELGFKKRILKSILYQSPKLSFKMKT
jgi:hypothetical protein